jgi:DNA (cytosine-5)-methyltransferase 1
VQKLIAGWNTDLKLWGNWETDLLSERWEPYLETWPTSGTMRNGQAFELQMPTRRTSGSGSSLLPTPIVRDYKDGQAEVLRDGKVQTDTIGRAIMNSGEVFLGTPRANAANPSSKQIQAGAPKSRLEDQVHTDWGKFAPAIRLWEQSIGREAPDPTKPDGRDGNNRLSSTFTEWMMGLPDGWITEAGLTRSEELKLAGNGVVPQQAELALRLLLNGDEE